MSHRPVFFFLKNKSANVHILGADTTVVPKGTSVLHHPAVPGLQAGWRLRHGKLKLAKNMIQWTYVATMLRVFSSACCAAGRQKTIQRASTTLFTDIFYKIAMRAQPGSGSFTARQGNTVLEAHAAEGSPWAGSEQPEPALPAARSVPAAWGVLLPHTNSSGPSSAHLTAEWQRWVGRTGPRHNCCSADAVLTGSSEQQASPEMPGYFPLSQKEENKY